MKTTVTEDGEIINEIPDQTGIPIPGPFWKTPWNYDRDAESARTGLACKDPSRTKQEFAKEADINVILAKFLNTGELNLTGMPIYQDIAEEYDLQDQMVTGAQVEEAWNALPAAVRNILKDPKTFSDYVEHCIQTGDIDPLRELGLANAKAPEQPIGGGGTPDPTPSTGTAPTVPNVTP